MQVANCPVCGVPARPAERVPPAIYYGCQVCETLFQHPMPSIAAMQAYVEKEYASGVYANYVAAAELKKLTFARRAQLIARRRSGGRLLDVGASCGFFVDEALGAGFDAYGVELSHEAVSKAPDALRRRLSVGDVNALLLSDTQPFDVVTAFDLVEHVFDPIDFLTQLRRVMRSGGLIAITTPDVSHPLRYVLRARWPMFQPMQHTVLFSRRGLRLALTRAGYEDVEISAARKTLTADYIAGQVSGYLPGLVQAYRRVSAAVPAALRNAPVSVNIGELMAFARVP
jgi:SAM-dependent methyltransferase